MRFPATSTVTTMTLTADENKYSEDVMTEQLYESPKSSPSLYSYLDTGYPSTSSDSQHLSKQRITTPGSFSSISQPVPLLTLPRVVLWCRDGVCYPYYKKPSKNGKPGPQIPDPRYCSFADRVIEDKTMPAIITMKSPGTILHSQESIPPPPPPPLNNVVQEDSLIEINTNNTNNYGDFKEHKHIMSVENIPSSTCTHNICSGVTSERSYRISTISSQVPHPISTYPDRVTLTVNSASSTLSSEKEQEIASRSSYGERDLSQRRLDLHQPTNNNNNGQFIHNKKEKNITRCSLGPVSDSTYAHKMSQHYPTANPKVFDLDSDLDDSVKLNSTILPNNNNYTTSSKTNSAHVLADSISYPGAKLSPLCPSCNGIVPLNPTEPPLLHPSKTEPGFWKSNNCYTNLHREESFHSSGGFTLIGQSGHIPTIKKYKMRQFCSSHKVAFVVSTFSLIATLGLIITLLLMKKKGMMEAMR